MLWMLEEHAFAFPKISFADIIRIILQFDPGSYAQERSLRRVMSVHKHRLPNCVGKVV